MSINTRIVTTGTTNGNTPVWPQHSASSFSVVQIVSSWHPIVSPPLHQGWYGMVMVEPENVITFSWWTEEAPSLASSLASNQCGGRGGEGGSEMGGNNYSRYFTNLPLRRKVDTFSFLCVFVCWRLMENGDDEIRDQKTQNTTLRCPSYRRRSVC